MNAVIIVSKAINYEVVNKVIFSCLEQNVCPLLFVILTALEFLILNPFDFRQAFYFSRQRKVEWIFFTDADNNHPIESDYLPSARTLREMSRC